MKPSTRRLRVVALDADPVPAPAPPVRTALRDALSRCTPPQRVVLALRLVERLSPVEAAATLGIPVQEFDTAYQAVMTDLRHVTTRSRATRRGTSPRAAPELARLRRAS